MTASSSSPRTLRSGLQYADLLGLGDAVIDIKVTPNRADCLGVRGIARDLAASGLGHLKPLDTTPVPGRFRSPIGIAIEDRSACPLFLGRHIRGLRNAASPDWLRRRLEAIGLRPISALVDITNFLTFDVNRPLHVFDAGRLDGDLTVRLGPRRRNPARAQRPGIHARRANDGDRRPGRGAEPRRGHRRRGDRLHRSHDRSVDRGGLVRSDPHRRHRPPAQHFERRPLSL